MPNKSLSCNKEDFFNVADALLKQGSSIRFSANGWSMQPSIRNVNPDFVRNL
ncbi:MAG: hypothetical protein HZB79_09275 [Deltaproteobacteria bacterium]|nr:hypothetical protein [Deltaproteobacteria bacterium]